MAYRLGVDVGGTFTDLLLIDDETGETFRAKTPSTPADPSQGVLVGIEKLIEDLDFAGPGPAKHAADRLRRTRNSSGTGRKLAVGSP